MYTNIRPPIVLGGPPPGAPLPRPGSVPAEVEVIQDQYLFGPQTDAEEAPKRRPARELAQKVSEQFVSTLFDGPGLQPSFFHCMAAVIQFWCLRSGAGPELETVGLPQNADTLLLPAYGAIRQSEPLLKKEVPGVFKEEDLASTAQAREQVETADLILSILGPLLYGATAMRSQGMKYLDGFCRRVYRRIGPEMDSNFLLNRDLAPLRQLVTEPAELAQKTLRLKDDVAAATEAATLDRVKEALGQAAAVIHPAPAGTPSAATAFSTVAPPLPEPLHGKAGRPPIKRGK